MWYGLCVWLVWWWVVVILCGELLFIVWVVLRSSVGGLSGCGCIINVCCVCVLVM